MSNIAKSMLPAIITILLLILIIAAFINAMGNSDIYGDEFGEIYGDTIQEKVWWALKDEGYSEVQIAGAMGNIEHESGFDATIVEGGYDDSTGGIGLMQWTNNDRSSEGNNTNLKKYAESKDKTWEDEDIQVEFMVSYLTGKGSATEYTGKSNMSRTYFEHKYDADAWETYESTGDVDKDLDYCTRAFLANYEGPSQEAANSSIQSRIDAAKKYYDEFHGKSKPSSKKAGSSMAGFSSSSNTGIRGKFKSSSGKFYTLYVQDNPSVAWYATDGCFHNSLATCMSAFGSGYTPNKLSGFSYGSGCSGNRADVAKVGCAYETIEKGKVKSMLRKGDPILFHVSGGTVVTDNGQAYYGGHWLAMLDYKTKNGKDRVFIHDPWGGSDSWGWADLDVINNVVCEWVHIYKK